MNAPVHRSPCKPSVSTHGRYSTAIRRISPLRETGRGLPRRKVLRTRHEQAKEPEYVPMKYEQTALDYSAITMEMLRTQV